MKTIYKYPIALQAEQSIQLPEKAQTLSVQVQNGVICIWAFVDTADALRQREVRVYGTGVPLPEDVLLCYIGTVQLDGYVWHIFLR